MTNPKISVIVPVYNLENYIDITLNSLINQTYNNLEIILIDDGSTDNSLKICNTFAQKDSRIKVIHTENKGVSSARNTGIEHATGEYISFCDGDDTVELDMYEFLYNNLVADNADISICGIKMVHTDNSVTSVSKGKNVIWNNKEDYIKDLLKGYISMSVSAKLFKASICKSVNFSTDLRTYEDKFYNFETAFKVNRITCHNTPKYTYYRRKGSSSIMEFSEKFFDGIKSADRMIAIIEETCPKLSENAHAHKLSTVLRTYTLMVERNGLKLFPNEAENIRKYIKSFNKKTAKKYLSKKNYIRYIVAKSSKTLFAFMCKHIEKS